MSGGTSAFLVRMRGGVYTVEGEVSGVWGLHRSVDMPGTWTVTHVPTGLAAWPSVLEQDARSAFEALVRELPAWKEGLGPSGFSVMPSTDECRPVREVVRRAVETAEARGA